MRGGFLAAAAVGALLIGGAGKAETLREALVRTYNTNPTITGQRAQLRTLDAGVAIARSAGRPQLSGTAGLNQDVLTTSRGRNNGRSFSAGVDVSYPLFNGGRVRNAVRAANTRVEAGRANLRATEGDVFTEAVAAYMDVIRDRSIVTLNENQVRVLGTNLQASRDRFEVGDLTRTDVAQSEARLALARSSLATAQGRLRASEENYRRVIGDLPDDLEPPTPLPPLPTTPDQAVDVALANNADLVSIAAQARAAGLDVAVARADRLPTLSAVNSSRYFNALGTADEAAGVEEGLLQNSTVSTGVGLAARIPLYQGGLVGARVRQAQAAQSQLLEQGVAVERAVVANARASFSGYRAALEAIQSNEIAVSANNLALEGTRAEQTVGTRNVLDVLNAEQELLNSQVALVTARRDAYVAGFQLLNAMGRAEAEDLGLDGGPLYDPTVNYERVSRTASDWAQDPTPAPVASRTVAGPPNDPQNTPVTQPR
jgi:outer membrane protein